MFYESKHPLNADYFKCETGVDFSFPSHLHHCFEFLYIINGQMNVQIDDLSYTLAEGSGLLIFPNQIHSLNCTNHSEHILCLFSPKLVSAFTEKNTSKVPTDNLFFPDSFYITQLKYLSGTNINENKILLKGLLYSLCGEFNKTASYHEASVGSNILLHNIFNFIETNYNKNCLLEDLSKHTGYNYAYLSKYL